MALLVIDVAEPANLDAEAYAACRAYLDQNINRVPLHDGVGDLLAQLKARQIPIAIVTGRSWNTTEVILKHHGILGDFVTIIANDHVERPKPAPLGIQLALTRMKMDPDEIVYVGDSHVDIMAARAAGSRAVAALWDRVASRERLAVYDPHHWATHPSQLLDLV